LAQVLGLTRSTTHRLAATLTERRFLVLTPREGYTLGPQLLTLGFLAQQQRPIVQAARQHLESLALATGDTVHLGVLDQGRALYLDKLPGNRRIEISSRVGDRYPVTSTGLGKALILDDPGNWPAYYDREGKGEGRLPGSVSRKEWLARMKTYAARGHAFDLEENEDSIRCVAAPIRDVAGCIVGAISVSGVAQYMQDDRMAALVDVVKRAARAISEDLGWSAASAPPRPRKIALEPR
jgi:DNA-binding IclR family transcriptional regulator